jgi:ABC-2 type transport system permease protein
MLKGATSQNLQYDSIVLLALMLSAMTVAVTRFRRTLAKGLERIHARAPA